MTTTLTTSRGGYVGWLKVGRGPWRRVIEAPTYDDAIADLMHHAEGCGSVHRDLLVNTGTDPNARHRHAPRTAHGGQRAG